MISSNLVQVAYNPVDFKPRAIVFLDKERCYCHYKGFLWEGKTTTLEKLNHEQLKVISIGEIYFLVEQQMNRFSLLQQFRNGHEKRSLRRGKNWIQLKAFLQVEMWRPSIEKWFTTTQPAAVC